MEYKQKDYEKLIGVNGLSEILLKNHFTLYQGYVSNINKLIELLNSLAESEKAGTLEFAELKRRLGWEFNGMRLHEYYFGSLSKQSNPIGKNLKIFKKINEDFESYENWEKEFKSMGAMRGIGWVVLYFDAEANRLFNTWINEHDAGHFSGAIPLLVMDVFEHAYMTDYGLKKKDYIETFFKLINWEAVNKRFTDSIERRL